MLRGQKELCHKNFILNLSKKFTITCKINDYSSPLQHIYWKNYSVKTRKVFTQYSGMDEKSKTATCSIQFLYKWDIKERFLSQFLWNFLLNSFPCQNHNFHATINFPEEILITFIPLHFWVWLREWNIYLLITSTCTFKKIRNIYLIKFHKYKTAFPHGSLYYENCFSDFPSFI